MKFVVHCKREPYDVYIGRGSKWGNPYSHLSNSTALYRVSTREESIEKYADYLMTHPILLLQIKHLRGKVLGCYCAPLPYHGDILATLANSDCD